MIITINEANALYGVLNKFAEEKLPIKLSYKIMKLLVSLEVELEFYKKQIQEILKDCAVIKEDGQLSMSEDGSTIDLKPEKIQEFETRKNELFGMEVEVTDFQFTLEELEHLSLTPKDMYALENFIKEEEEPLVEDEE